MLMSDQPKPKSKNTRQNKANQSDTKSVVVVENFRRTGNGRIIIPPNIHAETNESKRQANYK